MPRRSLPWLSLLAAACGNSSNNPSACTGEAEPAVVVQLVAVGLNTPVVGATVVLSEGSYVVTMVEGPDGSYYGGFERPGTYQVEVAAAGYQPVTVTGIAARALRCGPETQTVPIALTPVPSPLLPALLLGPAADGSFGILAAGFAVADGPSVRAIAAPRPRAVVGGTGEAAAK